ncbi:hypothetical protein ACB092_05G243300 [Castanea dentata]
MMQEPSPAKGERIHAVQSHCRASLRRLTALVPAALGGSTALFNLAMDECPLSLPENSPSMPNVQASQSQYDSIEADGQSEIVNVPIDVEDDEDDEDGEEQIRQLMY